MNEPGIVGDLGPGDIGSLSVDASVHALASSTRHKWESIVQTLRVPKLKCAMPQRPR